LELVKCGWAELSKRPREAAGRVRAEGQIRTEKTQWGGVAGGEVPGTAIPGGS